MTYRTVSDLVSDRVGDPCPFGTTAVKRPISIRIGDTDLSTIDFLSQELGMSRQSFLYSIISSGISEAIEAIEDAYSDDSNDQRIAQFLIRLQEVQEGTI